MMKNMTQGNPVKLIVGFAIPMLIGNIFQQAYSLVDTIIVGRYLGEKALAGVGSTGTLTFFMLALIMGLCNGAGLVIAQCFGCSDTKNMKKSIVSLIWVASILTIIVTLLGVFGSKYFLKLLNVPEDVMGYSEEYLQIIYIFIAGSVAYNGAASILRSIGDSRTPLIALIVACILNIGLDILFILKYDMGVSGVAYATVISQILSAALCIGYIIKRHREIGLTEMDFRPNWESLMLIFRTGFPSAFQSSMIALGGMSVQRLVNSYGASVMAAYVAANRVDSVAIQVIVSIGTALSVFTGQNMGQGDFKRIHEGLKKTLVLMLGASVTIAVMVLIFRRDLMLIFLDAAEARDAIEIGTTYLSIIGIAYVIAGIMQSYQNVIRGSGDVNTCMVAGLTELGGRIIFAYLLANWIGVTGIWIATPISWGCGCIIPVVRYYSGKWKTKKLI